MLRNDAFGRQVSAMRAGQQYQRTDTDMVAGISDAKLRKFAFNAYTPNVSRPSLVDGFSYVAGLSSPETAVYINPATRQATIAFRGSATRSDFLKSDVALATGKLDKSARFQRTASEFRTAQSALKGYTLYTTGHSLGATLGEKIAHDGQHGPAVNRHVSFNPGYGPSDWYTQRTNFDRSTAYRNRMDLISFAGAKKASDMSYRAGYLLSAHRAVPERWSNSGI